MRIPYLCVFIAFILAGCGGGGANGPTCASPQTLMVVGYSTGSAPANFPLPIASSPYPAAATFLYFFGSQWTAADERRKPSHLYRHACADR